MDAWKKTCVDETITEAAPMIDAQTRTDLRESLKTQVKDVLLRYASANGCTRPDGELMVREFGRWSGIHPMNISNWMNGTLPAIEKLREYAWLTTEGTEQRRLVDELRAVIAGE
jgi:hypothetical protein